MLASKDFCRNHERNLDIIFYYGMDCSYKSNYCFTGSDISLQQSFHGVILLHIFEYLENDYLLMVGKRVGKFGDYLFYELWIHRDFRGSAE
jgi:hypothetical protein